MSEREMTALVVLTCSEIRAVREALIEAADRWQRRPGFRGQTVTASPYDSAIDQLDNQARGCIGV